MNISYITVGEEILNGKIKDTNTFTLSSFTKSFDFKLIRSIAIPDKEESILKAIELSKDSDCIILSGGLGPTKDDITDDVLIKKYGDNYKEVQNHNGVAKGLYFKENNQHIIATPGVPLEFKMMLEKEIFNLLKITNKKNNQVIFKTYKMGEWKIFNELCPTLWEDLEKYGEVSCLPVIGGVNIGVSLKSINRKNELIDYIKSTKLGDLIWHIGDESLEEVIIQKAKEKKLKIGFAESCTGGLLASKITDVPGSSSVFWGSIVSYSNEVKMKALNVKEKTLENYGAVSLEVAKEMAIGAKDRMNLDIAVTTTGIAGPNGGSENKPVGTVCIGIATKNEVSSLKLEFKGNREMLKERFAKAALYTLLEKL